MSKINIIGAGLAGSECAIYLANKGHKVNLYDIKTKSMTPAHSSRDFAEIVCSNSLKSDDISTASGVFKRELLALGSTLIKTAYDYRVPAGQALAVDREEFSKKITELIKSNSNITIHCEDVGSFEEDAITVIATGPLSTDNMCNAIKKKIGEDFFYFYDAVAPIVSFESVDMSKAFFASRYDKGGADYLNCAMNKDEYLNFYNELVNAKTAELHEFEKNKIFESCMPIEIMAKRGVDGIRFGPLKPVGIKNPHKEERPYAVVQLRKENAHGTMYNLVGFQTNLTFPEQKRVFSLIPGLENAEFLRYGVMHTNNFVNFPKCLDVYSRLICDNNIFIAGQLSGVEGYVESIASGLYCAINIDRMINKKELISFSADTILGGLYNYLINANPKSFQPINANFGILNPIEERDKAKRNLAYGVRSNEEIKRKLEEIKE
ncbi:MAG: methylenetetrahydrofolate--tRNA-(uracil(54)-C(5))-methyltransferase (FADH(2)-oxidizing) TrmFO [Clostridiales bacterium]|nr:methylenetetrahydrofolate--tRNA-(uracil(54)-C(5))-methyltransferase (FADH(2)-oxidizing) TrmFO [Clostridiales bacterium]